MKLKLTPKQFEYAVSKLTKVFILPVCYTVNGKFNRKKLLKRRDTLRRVEAYIRIKLQHIDFLLAKTKEQ